MKERNKDIILADAEDVKDTVLRLSRRKVLYPHVLTARGVSRDWAKIDEFKTSKEDDAWFASFSALIDEVVKDERVTAIRVTARNGSGVQEVDKVIEKYINDVPTVVSPTVEGDGKGGSAMNDFARQFLGLMGVPADSISTDNPQGMLFGAALTVNKMTMERDFNDKLAGIERRHEQEESARKLAEAEAKVSQQAVRIKELEKDKEKLEKDLEKAYDQIDTADEELRKRESLRPENSVMGVSLAGLMTMVGQNLIRKNASVIGKLAGVSGEQFLGMLDAQDAEAAAVLTAPAANVTPVAVEEADGRTESINAVEAALRSMPEADFTKCVNSVLAYAQALSQATGVVNANGQIEEV